MIMQPWTAGCQRGSGNEWQEIRVLRFELGPGRGHFSLENGISDSWIAKISRCARLRTWGFAPPVKGTPSRTLTPVTLGGRRHPEVYFVVARQHPPLRAAIATGWGVYQSTSLDR